LVIVDPSNIPTNTVQPNVYIEDIIAGEESFSSVDAVDGRDGVKIDYDQSIEFSLRVDSYAVPSENRLKTRLRGINDWVERSSEQNEVKFSQLASGSYVFDVMGSNNDGVWSESKALRFTILPPWWRSTLAYLTYAVAMLALMVMFFRHRTKQLQQRAKALQAEVELRTQELAQEKQMVESLLEQKNNEFANVSHEFRTPLTLILGPVNKLLEQTKKLEDKKILSMVQRNTQRLVRMVDQILHLERHKIKQVTELVTQDVSGTLDLIFQSFISLTDENKQTFQREVEANLSIDIAMDSLDKIVINLLSNAIKYTPQGGSILLKAWKVDNKVFISVTDTGFGIALDKQQEVFNKFSRVLDEHSEKITGAGIGLALVKELVESQKGQIVLESELGKGSQFTVSFPASAGIKSVTPLLNSDFIDIELSNLAESKAALNTATIQEDDTSLSLAKPLILVVEDNPDMREYIVSNLSNDYRCIEAANGRVGVEQAIEHIPDLIISDVMMPEMDGFELSNTVKSNPLTSHVPLILLTARGDKKSRIRGWREHADEYLTKPFDADELLIRIENLLAIRDMIRQRYQHQIQNMSSTGPRNEGDDGQEYSTSILDDEHDSIEHSFVRSLYAKLELVYQDSELTVDSLARELGCSNRQFQRKITGLLNLTPSLLLREYRLNKSVELLQQGHKPNTVYLDSGFNSHSYFSRCFKARFNCSPSEFCESSFH
jgi:signal transduction histidine kinase/DNA-binding response OmpR family regulator